MEVDLLEETMNVIKNDLDADLTVLTNSEKAIVISTMRR